MLPPPSTPIVIGVGDFINRSKRVEDAVEPLQLMLNAIKEAIADTGLSGSSIQSLRAAVDSLDVVRTWTWPYPDLPGLIAQRLNINPTRKHYSDHGGNQPGLAFDEAARRVSKGETRVAILTGGEALASCTHTDRISDLVIHANSMLYSSICMRSSETTPASWLDTHKGVRQRCLLSYDQRDETWCVACSLEARAF